MRDFAEGSRRAVQAASYNRRTLEVPVKGSVMRLLKSRTCTITLRIIAGSRINDPPHYACRSISSASSFLRPYSQYPSKAKEVSLRHYFQMIDDNVGLEREEEGKQASDHTEKELYLYVHRVSLSLSFPPPLKAH